MNEHIEAPTTIKEVGIHVGYMRDDIKELKDTVKALATGFVSVKDFTDLQNQVIKIESKQGLKNTIMWVALVATTLTAVIALYKLFAQ